MKGVSHFSKPLFKRHFSNSHFSKGTFQSQQELPTLDSRNFNLPAGTNDITIISSYRTCVGTSVDLLFDGGVVQTVGGFGNTAGCDYNSI